MTANERLALPILEAFAKQCGPVEVQSPWHPFTHSSYYEKEMGKSLQRCLIAFQNIFEPHRLPELKKLATELENQTSAQRCINVDPGYVDLFKVVLASRKSGGQKIALTSEVFAYTLLRYEKGTWHPFRWTYPDFKEETYYQDLLKIRERLKLSLRA